MGKRRGILLFIVCWLSWLGISASNVGMGHTTLSKDTLNYGDTLFISTVVINFDTVFYQGTVDFVYKLNGIENIDGKIFPNPLGGQLINIAGGDSVPVYIHVIITPAYFLPGPDILVVWPLCPDNPDGHNQITANLFVRDPTDISGNLGQSPPLKIYTSADGVIIDNHDSEITLNRVRIFDVLGRQINVTECTGNHQFIPLNNQPNGIYVAEVWLSNGQKALFKIFKL